MKEVSGPELIATAGAVSCALACVMDNDELHEFCELLGLVRYNLDIIRHRRHEHDRDRRSN